MTPRGGVLSAAGYMRLEFKGQVQAGEINLKGISI